MTDTPPRGDDAIQHARECPECGARTFEWERCHVCGDCHWKDDARAQEGR